MQVVADVKLHLPTIFIMLTFGERLGWINGASKKDYKHQISSKFRVRQKVCSAFSRWSIATHQSRTQHFSKVSFLGFLTSKLQKEHVVEPEVGQQQQQPILEATNRPMIFPSIAHWKASRALLPGLSTQMCMDKTSVGQDHLIDSSFLWFSPLLYIHLI